MDLLQLQYFRRLAESQHVTRTARELNISQPALSATIKKLENELGAPLFTREGRNITLSPYGRIFRDYVEEAFLSLENGRRAVADLWNGDALSLTVGLLEPLSWKDMIREFSTQYPGITLNVLSIEYSRFTDSLLDGQIDLYLGGTNGMKPGELSRVHTEVLREDDMVVMVPASHPLAGRETIDLRELKDEAFINLTPGSNFQEFINTLFQEAGFEPHVSMICDSSLRFVMVAEGHGIIITTRNAAGRATTPGLSWAMLSYPKEKRRVGLVWYKGHIITSSMDKFIRFAREYYRELN